MAKANGGPRGRPPHKNSRAALPEPGDEQATYTPEQLIRMDSRFRARLLRTFERGEESRESAAHAFNIPSRDLVELLAFPPPLQ